MTYFRMGIHTIIGAGSFHCPVRDGKEWDQTAMVAKHKLSNWEAEFLLLLIYSLSFAFGDDCLISKLYLCFTLSFYFPKFFK